MKNIVLLLVFVFTIVALSACGGGGGRILPPPQGHGSINGSFTVNNTLPDGATLSAELYKSGLEAPVATATLTLNGTSYPYQFLDLAYGTYRVRLLVVAGALAITMSETGDIELTTVDPDRADITTNAILADGTLSGSVKVAGTFPSSRVVYVYIYRTDVTVPPGPPDSVNSFAFNVTQDMIVGDSFDYNVENMSYGVYHVALVGYDPVTHAFDVYGEYSSDVKIDVAAHNPEGKRFAAGFGVTPPDLENGTIHGTVSFTGTPDWSFPVYVSANTIPPAQGAPPANFQITEAAYVSGGMSFELTGLPQGDYSVSIYQYNFTTHQATYFGNYTGNAGVVNIASNDAVVDGIDFQADWTLLG